MLQEKYQDAALAIAELIDSSAVPAASAELALLHADKAHCLARLGQFALAASEAKMAASIPSGGFDADDCAVISGALRDYSISAGESDQAEKFRRAQHAALDLHKKTIAELLALLEPYSTGPAKTA